MSGIAQGISTIMQGRISDAQGKMQQKVAEYNAKQLDREAKAKMDAARIQSDRISRQEKIVESANRAKAGKSGISLSESKSYIDVLADTAYQYHLDRNFTLMQGLQDKISMQSQASLLRAEGAFAKQQGDITQRFSTVAGGVQIGAGLYASTYKPTTKIDTPSGFHANTNTDFKNVWRTPYYGS